MQRARSAAAPLLALHPTRSRLKCTPPPTPTPNQVIAKTSSLNPVAGYTLEAGGLEWAYRRNEVAAGSEGSGSPDVLLIHGLGSSSYRWVQVGMGRQTDRS